MNGENWLSESAEQEMPSQPHLRSDEISQTELESMAVDRDLHVKRVLEATSTKKLIVAGPGTGKTFLFGQVLRKCGGGGLVLTFINNLVEDLKRQLDTLAEVYTHLLQLGGGAALEMQICWHLVPEKAGFVVPIR